MCELFGMSSADRRVVNPYLEKLMSHSTEHPHGWGIAVFYGDAVSLEKEPKPAFVSDYLASRLKAPMEVQNMIAHIRLATRGKMTYENCHPFVKRDAGGRAWTLAHNGTIFDSEILDYYKDKQEGSTDSERIICHIIHKINELAEKKGEAINLEDRCLMMDDLVREIVPGNKVNLLVYDGEILYVHTNMKGSLYRKCSGDTVFFATSPLDDGDWKAVPMMQLFAYKKGKLVFEGKKHEHEYIKPDSDLDKTMYAVL